ncbi:kelch-like [Chamberlinius hualienensis]
MPNPKPNEIKSIDERKDSIEESASTGNSKTNRRPEPLYTNEGQLRYPFEEAGDFLKFPRKQLYRQNSQLAVLLSDPDKYMTVEIVKNNQNEKDDESVVTVPVPKIDIIDDKQSEAKEPDKKRLQVTLERKPNPEPGCETHIEVKAVIHDKQKRELFEGRYSESAQLTVIGHRLLDVSRNSEFLLSDVDAVCDILCSNDLEVVDEAVVFRAAHRWIRFQSNIKLDHASKVLKCVRFGLINPRDLVKCYKQSESFGLLEDSLVQRKLFEGLVWSTAAHFGLKHLVTKLKPEPRRPFSYKADYPSSPLAYSPTSSDTSLDYSPIITPKTDDTLQSKFVNGHNTVIIIGGITDKSTVSNGSQVLCYSPNSNSWNDMKPFPTSISSAAACYVETADGRFKGLYVTGGCQKTNSQEYNNVTPISFAWKYHPETKLWTRLATMSQARMNHCLVWVPQRLNGSYGIILAIGGANGQRSLLSEVEAYNLETNEWTSVAELPRPMKDFAAIYHDGKVWVCGGYSDRMLITEKQGIMDTVMTFKWSEKTWTIQKLLRIPRKQASLVSFENVVYIIGGITSTNGQLESVSAIDFITSDMTTWKHLTDLPTPRFSCACFISKNFNLTVVSGMKLDENGERKTSTNIVESYNLKSKRWMSHVENLPKSVEGFCWASAPIKAFQND